MAEFLLGNTLVSDEKKTPCETKFWVEGQGWTELEEVPKGLLAEAVKLLLKEKNAAYDLVREHQKQLDDIREILGCDG
jgi:hypothetical protein